LDRNDSTVDTVQPSRLATGVNQTKPHMIAILLQAARPVRYSAK